MTLTVGCVAQARLNVLTGEAGKISDNFFLGHAGGKIVQNIGTESSKAPRLCSLGSHRAETPGTRFALRRREFLTNNLANSIQYRALLNMRR